MEAGSLNASDCLRAHDALWAPAQRRFSPYRHRYSSSPPDGSRVTIACEATLPASSARAELSAPHPSRRSDTLATSTSSAVYPQTFLPPTRVPSAVTYRTVLRYIVALRDHLHTITRRRTVPNFQSTRSVLEERASRAGRRRRLRPARRARILRRRAQIAPRKKSIGISTFWL